MLIRQMLSVLWGEPENAQNMILQQVGRRVDQNILSEFSHGTTLF